MENVYKILFLAGLVYTTITTLLGTVFDVFNIGEDIDLDGDLPWFSIFKPVTIVSFITVFDGVGLIGISLELNQVLTFCIAVVTAFIASYSINKFIVIPLYKAQNTSAPTNEDLIGIKAAVISTIYEDGFGTISYSFKGNRYTSPAKHLKGKAIKKGEEVQIREIREKIFYVIPSDKTLETKNSIDIRI